MRYEAKLQNVIDFLIGIAVSLNYIIPSLYKLVVSLSRTYQRYENRSVLKIMKKMKYSSLRQELLANFLVICSTLFLV